MRSRCSTEAFQEIHPIQELPKGYHIPVWLRLVWVDFTPDPEQLCFDDLTPHGREFGSEVKWGQKRPTIPDRWIYHLFMAGRSNVEIGRILKITPEHVTKRVTKLIEAHWITEEMRKAKQIETAARRRRQRYTMKKPRFERTRKVWKEIGNLMRNRRAITIAEMVKITGGSVGTVTRYASMWRERIRNAEE